MRVHERTTELRLANENLTAQIMERERTEGALRAAEIELARITRATTMGQFAVAIAHEVNQPLAGVVMNASACTRWLSCNPPDLEEANAAAQRTIRDAHRAGEVIARVRRMVSRRSPEESPVDINQAISDVLGIAGREIENHGILIRQELAHGLPPVLGDRVELQQVILNLVINAMEAIDSAKGGQREINIRSEPERGDGIRVTVEDSGPGVDPANAANLFETFFSTKDGGIGLGLSICRSLTVARRTHIF
jgi:C4-dicarboxylate-specific signal transduction histidine kinase